MPTAGERYALTAKHFEDSTVELNERPLRLMGNGDLPQISGEAVKAGRLNFAPASIMFLSIAGAANGACK